MFSPELCLAPPQPLPILLLRAPVVSSLATVSLHTWYGGESPAVPSRPDSPHSFFQQRWNLARIADTVVAEATPGLLSGVFQPFEECVPSDYDRTFGSPFADITHRLHIQASQDSIAPHDCAMFRAVVEAFYHL